MSAHSSRKIFRSEVAHLLRHSAELDADIQSMRSLEEDRSAALEILLLRVLHWRVSLTLRDTLECMPDWSVPIPDGAAKVVSELETATLRLAADAKRMRIVLSETWNNVLSSAHDKMRGWDSSVAFQYMTRRTLTEQALSLACVPVPKRDLRESLAFLEVQEWQETYSDYAIWALGCGLSPFPPGAREILLGTIYRQPACRWFRQFDPDSDDLMPWIWPLGRRLLDDPVIPGWMLACSRSRSNRVEVLPGIPSKLSKGGSGPVVLMCFVRSVEELELRIDESRERGNTPQRESALAMFFKESWLQQHAKDVEKALSNRGSENAALFRYVD